MNTPFGQEVGYLRPRPSRRYERLIGTLLNLDMVDVRKCEKRAIYSYVVEHTDRYHTRCHAMALAANHFGCSYEKVRAAVYEIEKQLKTETMTNSKITIRNEAECAIIDIEGTIGLSEEWQFENPDSRIATYERFRGWVSQIADIEHSHIVVNIRSTGGDVNDALLIYEALRATGAHITTRCYGYTASAATVIAQAATEGCREIASSSLYLIHNSICSTEGNAEELEAEVEMLRQTDHRLAEIYAQRSGHDIAEIEALMAENGGRGRWLSPAEAIAKGLVDSLVAEPQPRSDEQSFTERAKQGVKALLRAIGINDEGNTVPDVADDINYTPRDREELPQASASSSLVGFKEGQRAAHPTSLKQVDDPSPVEPVRDSRSDAYNRDARSMRQR